MSTTLSIEEQDAAARVDAARLKEEIARAHPETLRLMFTEARTHNGWRDIPVADETLVELYDLMKWAPTSMNAQPARFVFVRSAEAKEKLRPLLSPGNVDKTMAAPVTVIIGHDVTFWRELGRVFPVFPGAADGFRDNPQGSEVFAFRNGTLEGAYLILAARALGLDTGPMSGFDNAKVDEAFFSGTSIKSNFLCNLGYADETKIFRRLPRLAFDEVAKIV
ncbi:MAG: malonic semialdehyde reductase [Hyphomicrobiales bacterium]